MNSPGHNSVKALRGAASVLAFHPTVSAAKRRIQRGSKIYAGYCILVLLLKVPGTQEILVTAYGGLLVPLLDQRQLGFEVLLSITGSVRSFLTSKALFKAQPQAVGGEIERCFDTGSARIKSL